MRSPPPVRAHLARRGGGRGDADAGLRLAGWRMTRRERAPPREVIVLATQDGEVDRHRPGAAARAVPGPGASNSTCTLKDGRTLIRADPAAASAGRRRPRRLRPGAAPCRLHLDAAAGRPGGGAGHLSDRAAPDPAAGGAAARRASAGAKATWRARVPEEGRRGGRPGAPLQPRGRAHRDAGAVRTSRCWPTPRTNCARRWPASAWALELMGDEPGPAPRRDRPQHRRAGPADRRDPAGQPARRPRKPTSARSSRST